MSLEATTMKIFIGYDENESLSFHALTQSLIENASIPLSITPIKRSQLKEFNRPRTHIESSDFSISRFLVPHLSNYQGWSLYLDCDFIINGDIAELLSFCDQKYKIYVCKHDYTPKNINKKTNQIQLNYKYKNWSSLILFNNEKCKNLTPEYINTAPGLDLHQFSWISNTEEIGSIPLAWNYLVGEKNQDEKPIGLHFTNGTPWETKVDVNDQNIWNEYLFKIFSPRKTHTNDDQILFSQNNNLIQSFIFKNEKYFQIPPLFKNSKLSKTDYLQYINASTGHIYHLKDKNIKFRTYELKFPLIESQLIGSKIARTLLIETQEAELIEIDQAVLLLTEDIRGRNGITKMEPISFLSKSPIQNTEDDKKIIIETMNELTNKDTSSFFIKLSIYDLLIAYPFRDARSIRLIYDSKEKTKDGQFDPIYDFIIETFFGAEYLFENCPKSKSVLAIF